MIFDAIIAIVATSGFFILRHTFVIFCVSEFLFVICLCEVSVVCMD